MNIERNTLNRIIIGVMAPGCLAAALAMYLTGWPADPLWPAGCIRVGLLLSVLWFALPTAERPAAWASVSPWMLIGIAVAAAFVPKYWRVLIPLFIVVMMAGLVLRPKKKHRPGGPYSG